MSTYIQSGNVVFASRETGLPGLVTRIERMLAASFDYEASVVVRNRTQMRAIVDRAPTGFGSDPSRVPLRRHLPEAPADRANRDEERPHQGGR